MDALDADISPVRRIKKRHVFGAAAVLLALLFAVVWAQRFKIADDLIRDRLNESGVEARYEIDEIGFRTERLKNVVIGDPANPDLTARIVEVEIAIGFGTPAINAVRAEGVRLRGRVIAGKISFGALDKFADPASKEPFALPAFNVDLKDAILSLATPWGGIGAALDGKGHARNGFDGRLVVSAPQLTGSGCTVSALQFNGALRTRAGQAQLDGSAEATGVRCAGQNLAIAKPILKGAVKLSPQFDHWDGNLDFAAGDARLSGHQLTGPAGTLSFFGDRKRTEFDALLARSAYRGGLLAMRQLSGTAKGRIALAGDGVAVSGQGEATIGGGSVAASALAGIDGVTKGTQATPIGPIMAALDPALKRALRAFDGKLAFDGSIGGKTPALIEISRIALASQSGAQIGETAPLRISNGRIISPFALALNGGGLPDVRISLLSKGKGWSGTVALPLYAKGGASLSIPNLAFSGGATGWAFDGNMTLSGPLMGGRIDGLFVPLNGRYAAGAFAMLPGCRQVRFARFQTGALTLPAQSLNACAQGAAMLQAGKGRTDFALTVPALDGRGSLGTTPLSFSGANVRFDLAEGFAASNVAIDLGDADSVTRFMMASFDGRLTSGGVQGQIGAGEGKIGNVPLLIQDVNGKWAWNNGVFTLDGAAFVADAQQDYRFNRMAIPSMQVALENGVISAIGYLAETRTGTRVADVDIRHELNSATGRALLAVESLTFDDRLQPEMLTPLTLGAIANVAGSISGDGIIEWDGNNLRSRGKFGTESLDFAAAFGPVTGLATQVDFTDLLGMETAPAQLAKIAVVNPGVPAFDGKLQYRLLPDQKVQIEGGRWPFYGGELILEPTILDFDVQAKRELTFRLVGLDSEKFLAGYELENLSVSGVFDGTLPMVFDAEGGRIVGGWLVSRPGGGEVSYLGQLSYEDMGAIANYAFEALRSIRFDEMQIGVDGNIAGEVITQVRFKGLQQGSLGKRNYITAQLAKLPIQFNVRIEAEFLQLIGSLRALYDDEYAAQRYQGMIDAPPPVTGEEDKTP